MSYCHECHPQSQRIGKGVPSPPSLSSQLQAQVEEALEDVPATNGRSPSPLVSAERTSPCLLLLNPTGMWFEWRKQKQTHWYREKTSGCQRRRGLGGCVKKGKGLRSIDSWFTKQSQGCKAQRREHSQWYCNNCVAPGGHWKYRGKYFVKYRII